MSRSRALPPVIAPSILSADFARLGEEVKNVLAAGADWIHFDVMDNHYVPNLTIGPVVCEALRRYGVKAPIDVHLMVEPVDALAQSFAKAGASSITFHPEATRHVDRSLQAIRDAGCRTGLVINPATSLDAARYVLDKLDILLLMSVNPGFGGQHFIPIALDKLREARNLIDAHVAAGGQEIRLEIDGGVKVDNIGAIAAAGADTFVAGSAIFGANDYAATIRAMRQAIAGSALKPRRVMDYTHIALTRELPADLDTPVGAYLKLADAAQTFLFESVVGGDQWGRYSFIGLPAREWLTVRGESIRIVREGQAVETVITAEPMAWLRSYTQGVRVAPAPQLPRFTGGYVGYFGYDCVRFFEPTLKLAQPDTLNVPDVLLMLADEIVVFDNLRATLTLVVHAKLGDVEDHARAQARLDAIEAQLGAARPTPHSPLPGNPAPLEFTTSFPREPYLAAVVRAQEYIAAGDTFQIQLGQRLSAPFSAPAIALYRAIRRLNPSPYLYCLNLGDHHVVGSSPEILVRVADGEVTARPIAGTRPRGATPEADRAMERELLADPKEIAEHVMLIDLGRNDVGRVCETGVRLTEKMAIERYSHVMHIVSEVKGRLKAGLHPLDVLAATFPAGTLTGAPKVRTMELIEELEPVRRGLYGGAVGYIGFDGNMDLAIAIRTALVKDGQVHVQASAGIVADSRPQAEWEETLHKARAMLNAAAIAQAQFK